jgi:hypothetical protein
MQPDLFTAVYARLEPRKLARRRSPSTSHIAARRVGVFCSQHHAEILHVLEQHGANGLTVHEIAAYCRLTAHAIGKRTNELEGAKAIETRMRPGSTEPMTRLSPSNRPSRLWFLRAAA